MVTKFLNSPGSLPILRLWINFALIEVMSCSTLRMLNLDKFCETWLRLGWRNTDLKAFCWTGFNLLIVFLLTDQTIAAKFRWLSKIDLYTWSRELNGKNDLLWLSINAADTSLPLTRFTCSSKVKSSMSRTMTMTKTMTRTMTMTKAMHPLPEARYRSKNSPFARSWT